MNGAASGGEPRRGYDSADEQRWLHLGRFGERSARLSQAVNAGDPEAIVRAAHLPGLLVPSVRFLLEVYRGRTRKVTGASALLHPLRVAMVLHEGPAQATEPVVAAALFHDYVEDTDEPADGAFFGRHGIPCPADVARWVDGLTRRREESYVAHVTRVCRDPLSVTIKAGDVIDNLLDLRTAPEFEDDEQDLDGAFHRALDGHGDHREHPPTARIRGAARLYAVWKCFALLNLARVTDRSPFVAEELCRRVGLRECQRIAIHLLRHHLEERVRQDLVEEHRRYCGSEALTHITRALPGEQGPDGLSVLMAQRSERKASLESLYADKPAMLLSTLALHEIFVRLGRPGFRVEGLESLDVA